MDADRITRAFTDLWQATAEGSPEVDLRAVGGALALVTGVPIPTINGVFAVEEGAAGVVVRELLEQVAGTGLPHCLQAREALRGRMAEVAADAGLVPGPDIPMMSLTETAGLDPALRDDLQVRRLEPSEMAAHVEIGAAGFEAPVEVFARMMDVIGPAPGLAAYVGMVDGVPVTTALTAMVPGRSLGVFNVATPPQHRGHGYGAAITAAAVLDRWQEAGRWAWLQSSTDGFGVYRRLGFEVAETWPLWLSP